MSVARGLLGTFAQLLAATLAAFVAVGFIIQWLFFLGACSGLQTFGMDSDVRVFLAFAEFFTCGIAFALIADIYDKDGLLCGWLKASTFLFLSMTSPVVAAVLTDRLLNYFNYGDRGSAEGIASILAFTVVMTMLRIRGDRGREQTADKWLRGKRPLATLAAAKIFYNSKKMPFRTYPDIPFGGADLPWRQRHFIFAGTTGAGKTNCIRMIAGVVLPTIARSRGHRGIWMEAKFNAWPLLRGMGVPERAITSLDHGDIRGAAWDIRADACDRESCERIGVAFFPTEGDVTTSGGQHFRGWAQIGVTEVLFSHHKFAADWSFRDVVLTFDSWDRIRSVLQRTPEGRAALSDLAGNRDSVGDVKATIGRVMSKLRSVAACWDRIPSTDRRHQFSCKRFLSPEAPGTILVLPMDPSDGSTPQVLNEIIFAHLSDLMLHMPETKDDATTSFIFCDELADAGNIGGIDELATKGRSKGVSLVLGFNSHPSLRKHLNEEAAKVVSNMGDAYGILRLTDESTADWAEQKLGYQEVLRTNITGGLSTDGQGHVTRNDGYQEAITKTPNVMRDDIMDLAKAERATGFGGYFFTPDLAWFAQLGPDYLEPRISELDPNSLARKPRPASHFELRDWNPRDYARLGLPCPTKEIAKEDDEAFRLISEGPTQ